MEVRLPLVTVGLNFRGGFSQCKLDGTLEQLCQQQHQCTLLAGLPVEILQRIFGKYVQDIRVLLNFRATCKAGNSLSIKIFSDWSFVSCTDVALIRVATIWCTSLHELELNGDIVTEANLFAIARGCPGLKSFKSSAPNPKTSSQALGAFFSALSSFESIEISKSETLDNWVLSRIAQNSRNLRRVAVTENSNIGYEGLADIAMKCFTTLREVDLSWCCNLSKDSIFVFLKNEPFNSQSNLTHLALNGCSVVDDELCMRISNFCPHLVRLEISDCLRVTEHGILCFAKSSESMRVLRCSGCINIQHVGFAVLFSLNIRLVELYADRCPFLSDICFLSLGNVVNNHLRVLDVSSTSISSIGVRAIYKVFQNLKTFSCKN